MAGPKRGAIRHAHPYYVIYSKAVVAGPARTTFLASMLSAVSLFSRFG